MAKRIKAVLVTALVSAMSVGCVSYDNKDLEITIADHYIDCTEKINVYTYNGYRCTGKDVDYDEDRDEYVVTIRVAELSSGEYKKEVIK